MRIGKLFQGSLFAGDLLAESIVRSADWAALDDEALHEIEGALQALLARFPTGSAPNESQTEDDLIWPVLQRLGWKASLRQQNLTAHGREDVPDGLLFADDAAKDRANGLAESSTACCSSCTPRTATCCRCATSATTTTASATGCAATLAGARIVTTPSPRPPPGTGRPSTISAGRSTPATRPSGFRPTTAASSTGNALRSSTGCGWAIGSWRMS